MQQPPFCCLLKITSIYIFLFLSTSFYAQTIAPPGGINYQAIARDTTGNPMGYCNNLKVKFSIWDTIIAGNLLFDETHDSVNTNRYGLFTLIIGSADTAGFDTINWAVGSKFLEVSIDSGGTGFVTMPRTQMVSVPYALHSKTALLSAYNWALEGNSTNSTHFLGTTNNSSLRFKTTNINRMIIDSLGRVGIGTLSPAALFEVAGQVKITGGTPGFGKVLTSDASGLASWAAPGFPYTLGDGLSLTSTTINSVWTDSGSDIYNNNTGNVGIGTNNPTYPLDISSSTVSPVIGNVALRNSQITGFAGISFYKSDASYAGGVGYSNASAPFVAGTVYLGTGSVAVPVVISPGTTEKMRVDGNGNVGIGTSNPAAKLDITGQIKITDGSEGVGKVLTSDASGLASWVLPVTTMPFTPGNGLSLSGTTLNSLWTASGNGNDDIYNNNSGNVGIGTSSPTSKLDVDGTISIRGNNSNELNRAQTGSANLLPIAYGNVDASASINSGTGNFTVAWEGSPNNRYNITITGETYTSSNYITLVTPMNDGPPDNGNLKFSTSDDGNGNLVISIYPAIGGSKQNTFQFVTYKP